MSSSDLEYLFACQNLLQGKIFGISPSEMNDTEAVDYIAKMVLEATDELHEILGEMTGWKGHQKIISINRDQAAREARDVLQYVINILLACGWEPRRLMDEYQAKLTVNHNRLKGLGGEKCIKCYRGLDDPGAVENCPEYDCLGRIG